MKWVLGAAALALVVQSSFVSAPARADDGRIAAGIAGGFLGGLLVGNAMSQPRYVYEPAPPPPPEPYYAPPPSPAAYPLVEEEPAYHCWWTRGERHWDGYRGAWVRRPVKVCE